MSDRELRTALKHLFVLSESRGKEAAGVAVLNGDTIHVLKSAIPASAMVKSPEYARLLDEALADAPCSEDAARSVVVIGHSRLVTTGNQYTNTNNQPVIAGQMLGVHNGIIVNHDRLWREHPDLTREHEVDTEIALALMRRFYSQDGTLVGAVCRAYASIEGSASLAVLFRDLDVLLLATNNGSLYWRTADSGRALVFASERYILQRLSRRRNLAGMNGEGQIHHLEAGGARLVDLRDLTIARFDLREPEALREEIPKAEQPRTVREMPGLVPREGPLTLSQEKVGLSDFLDASGVEYLARIRERFPHDTSWQDTLRRCTRCILPETMPFIDFDEGGVCNYCRNYRKLTFHGEEELREHVAGGRGSADMPDCVVGISGGRDSLYCLHYVTRVLGLRPVAYTYDWGMVTDLARRNISRICAKLGVEHILISADITKKRRFIRQNIAAWLRRPDLGMIPLFMAGDKHYFYHLQQVRRQTGAGLAIMGENMLERTDFKTGFAGVRPCNRDEHHVYTLPLWSSVKLAAFYGKQYLVNPAYINASLADTLLAYACFYLIDRNYLNLYNYIPWHEETVVPTLREEYNFELATDSPTTWRIGDGTAAFYNYIYHTVAGFTENETLRSNQIREGRISREEALTRVRAENKPRYETIFWYLNIIGLKQEMGEVLETIHAMPRVGRSTFPKSGT